MRLNICVDEDVRILLLLLYVEVKDDTCEDTASTAAIAAIRMKAMMLFEEERKNKLFYTCVSNMYALCTLADFPYRQSDFFVRP